MNIDEKNDPASVLAHWTYTREEWRRFILWKMGLISDGVDFVDGRNHGDLIYLPPQMTDEKINILLDFATERLHFNLTQYRK